MKPDVRPRLEFMAHVGRLLRGIPERLRGRLSSAASPGARIAPVPPGAGSGADLRDRTARRLRRIAALTGGLLPSAVVRARPTVQALPGSGSNASFTTRAGYLWRSIAARLPVPRPIRRREGSAGVLSTFQRILPGLPSGRSSAPSDTPATRHDISSAHRLGVTILFSVVVHLILILGVTFAREDHPERRIETLDVVLVPRRSDPTPAQPDYLAQANRIGGGDRVEREIASPPPPAPIATGEASIDPSEPSVRPLDSRLPDTGDAPGTFAPEPETATRLAEAAAARRRSPEAVIDEPIVVEPAPLARSRKPLETHAAAQPLPKEYRNATHALPEPVLGQASDTGPTRSGDPARTRKSDSATGLKRSAEIAARSAELERKLEAFTERPRRKWISARTREHRFAAYMDEWRRKVERVGNLNFPGEAARRGISGDLLLDVALLPDGTVESITLRRSSGKRVLDDAAVRIVELAAPFSKFPQSISDDVDILHIERTWIFRPGARPPSP